MKNELPITTSIVDAYLQAYDDKEEWARDMSPIDLCRKLEARVSEAEDIMCEALRDSLEVRFLLFQTKERMKKYISANVRDHRCSPDASDTNTER
jgi:hypothetical protein